MFSRLVLRATTLAYDPRNILVASLIILGGTFLGFAQEENPKTSLEGKATKTSVVATFHCVDGSLLKVQLLEEKISIQTIYGRLQIPVTDITSIEFALRFHEDEQQAIMTAIADLGDNNFKKREAATAALKKRGERGYFLLKKVSGSGNAEMNNRTNELIEHIENHCSPEKLVTRDSDVIQTGEMRIVGRIDTAYFRVQTNQFGEQRLRIADLSRLGDADDPQGNAAVAPENLMMYQNQVGKTFQFRVTGSIRGSVWGTDIYTLDSQLPAVAVHSGLLKPGQTGVVKVTILGPTVNFVGSTRNGVASQRHPQYPGAYRVSR